MDDLIASSIVDPLGIFGKGYIIFDRDYSHGDTVLLIYMEQSTDLTWSQASLVKDAATHDIGTV